MIGALLLQLGVKPLLEQSVARRDVDALMAFWGQEAVLELGGVPGGVRLVGWDELEAALQRWFDATAELAVTVGRVAVTRPWAVGVSNTLMLELRVEQTARDGTAGCADLLAVAELRAAKVVLARVYMLGPGPGRPLSGAKGLDVLIPPQLRRPEPRERGRPGQ